MGAKTQYYEYNLPANDDYADQNKFNENFESLDTTLHNMQTQIDSAAAGLKYKGAVNYYSNLPNNAEEGDAYTVLYAGSSGTVADGTEYVWGKVSGTLQWIDFSKDSYTKAEVNGLLTAKQNTIDSSHKLSADLVDDTSTTNKFATAAELEQIETNKNNILTINAELIGLVDSGAKNLCPVNSGTGTQRYQIDVNLPAGEYILYVGGLTSTDTDSATCQIIAMTSPTGTVVSPYVMATRESGKYYNFTLTDTCALVYIYASDSFAHSSGDTVTFSNLMICTKAAWDVSQKYVPYAMTNAEITAWIQAHT